MSMGNRLLTIKEFREGVRRDLEAMCVTDPSLRDALYNMAHDMFGVDFREVEVDEPERKEA